MTRHHADSVRPAPPRRARHAHTATATRWALLVVTVALCGCAPTDMSDLEVYTSEVMSRKGGRIEPLPPVKPYETYRYQSAGPLPGETYAAGAAPQPRRDPFKPYFAVEVEEDDRLAAVDDPRQEAFRNEINNRNREELENFELDSLRMVGTLQDTADLWGIVVDTGGTVYRVKVGNYMGRNIGLVRAIEEDRIELRELVADGEGNYQERPATIALSEP